MPVADLLEVYGKYLFGRLTGEHSELVKGIHSKFDMMLNIEPAIHTEDRKLYQGANPPRFESKMVSENEMKLTIRTEAWRMLQ